MSLSRQIRTRPERALSWLCVLLMLVLTIRYWIWAPSLIMGTSMWPTLKGGDFVGINKLAYAFRGPDRGDLVAVWTGQQLWVKRVVGLPGEEIGIRRGVLNVNGVPLAEPYVQRGNVWQNVAPGRIEPDCFVLAGDNRVESEIGVVSRQRIIGQIVTLSRQDRWKPSGMSVRRQNAPG
jgi:signal peptidase I